MNLNNISLPYPVLGISDDILPMLTEDDVEVDLKFDDGNYVFDIRLHFDNADIQKLIDDSKAEFTCEYVCSRTMLRCCCVEKGPHFTIMIPRRSVNGRISFNCFVSVKEPIANYSNKGFNSDYQGAVFDMKPGDILVAFPQFHYDADIRYDKLQAAGSFMQIREDNHHNIVSYDISGNKIEILMPTFLYGLYCHPAVRGSAEVMHASLVLNALTYALLNIEEHEQTTWAKTIYYRLDNEEEFSREDLEDPSQIPILAQRLLKDPYARMFNIMLFSRFNQSEE